MLPTPYISVADYKHTFNFRIAPHLKYVDVDETTFRPYWAHGIPLAVLGLPTMDMSPEYFKKHHPNLEGDIESSETNEEERQHRKVKMCEFFPSFGRMIDPTVIWKLKVCRPRACNTSTIADLCRQDVPPKATFQTIFQPEFDAFMASLPLGPMTRLNGARNFASHFPRAGVRPDLGACN